MLAFEVDAYDTETSEGWSVLALGRATVLTTQHEHEDLPTLDSPSAENPRSHYVRLHCELLTGRRMAPRSASVVSVGSGARPILRVAGCPSKMPHSATAPRESPEELGDPVADGVADRHTPRDHESHGHRGVDVAAGDGSERVGQRQKHETERERGRDDAGRDARARELEAERQGRGPDREDDEERSAEELREQAATE